MTKKDYTPLFVYKCDLCENFYERRTSKKGNQYDEKINDDPISHTGACLGCSKSRHKELGLENNLAPST